MSPQVQEPPKMEEKIETIDPPKPKESEPQVEQNLVVASSEPIAQEFPKDDFSLYIDYN